MNNLSPNPTAGRDFSQITPPDPFGDSTESGIQAAPAILPAHWSNWEGTYQCDAELAWAESLTHMRSIVHYAARHGKTIRVSGGGSGQPSSASYSGSPVVQNSGQIIVHLPKLNHCYLHPDGSDRITAEAGTTLQEFDEFALMHGLCLTTNTAPNFLTVGGATALSCHGSGNHGGTLSDLVVAVDIVRADGEVQTITAERDPEMLRAAQVNLGALGIVHTVTFQCVPRFKLLAVDELRDLRSTIDNIQSLVDAHDYVELFWFPFTNKVWVKMWDKVPWDTPDANRPNLKQEDFQQQMMAKIGEVALQFVVKFPRFTPPLMHLLMATTRTGSVVAPAPAVFHYTRYFPRQLLDLSYAVETGARFEKFKSAWNFVIEKVAAYSKSRGSATIPWSFGYGPGAVFPQNFLMHARFFKSSDAYMAPAVGFDRTVMMEAVTYVGSDVQNFYADLEKHWISLGGRPHWGKTYSTDQDFTKFYGENIAKFNAVREKLDPRGMFLNDFLRHVLGIQKRTEQKARP